MAVDLATVGTGAAVILSNVIAYFAGKGKREVKEAANDAERDVIVLLRQEVERLSARVTAMESREGRLIRHVYRLEALVRELGKEPPAFEIDGGVIRAGLTD